MTLDRLSLNLSSHPAASADRPAARSPFITAPKNALAFVRLGADSWRTLRLLERSVLEGAFALARSGHGQTLFVALHGPRSFADRRVDILEAKAIDPQRSLGLARDLLRAAIARPEARSLLASLPVDWVASLKSPAAQIEFDSGEWAETGLGFLKNIAAQKPLVIVLGYAHRADAESLAWLAALARAAQDSQLLLIVTYRIDAPANPHLARLREMLLEARLAHTFAFPAPRADEAGLGFQAAFGRSVRPESAAASIGNDATATLLHGLTVVEMCRRSGHWNDAKMTADRVADAGETHAVPFVAHSAGIMVGHILADQGKWDESLERLERIQSAVEKSKDDALIAWLYWGLARARWGKSDRRRAFQMLRLAQTVAARTSDEMLRAVIAACGAEWLADHRRIRVSRDWLGDLDRIIDRSQSLRAGALLAQANGAVALAEGDAISATGFFRSALRQWTVFGSEYEIARARLRLSSALLVRDDADSRREGREVLIDAHIAFTKLGAAADMVATEELGAGHGIRPRARRASSGGSASPGGITPREREVLELLVRGMTNRQIAATLSITEKTAEGHVSNILAKLGVASRGQAAGYAVANGLLEAAEA